MSHEEHARSWIAAWNARDIEAILEHYADDIDFVADTVKRRWDRPDGRLRGKAELRKHFERGLEISPQLHFELEAVFSGPDGYAVLYRRENGNRTVDTAVLDRDGRICRGRAYYVSAQP